MQNQTPSFWDVAVLYGSLVLAWLVGEGGRTLIAGAAGGLTRWWLIERRRLRDGIAGVFFGMLFARYLSPIMLAMLENWIGSIADTPDAASTAAFASGLGGMSVAKIVLAVIDAQFAAFRKPKGGGGEDA